MRFAFCVLLLSIVGCSLAPKPQSTSQRIAAFPSSGLPLKAPATIYWDTFQVPFIVANDDADAPFLLGMVHTHLRGGQMEILRRVGRGEISELTGPFTRGLDQTLRTIDFPRAVPAMKAALPPATATWIERYVAGINFYLNNTSTLPFELSFVGEVRPWTVEDVLTVTRVGGTDVNWLFWFRLLQQRGQPGFDQVWERLRQIYGAGLPSVGDSDLFASTLLLGARSGSNAFAVSGKRTSAGAPIMAGDPHVGINLPNLWVLVGIQSPTYHVTGFSIAGVPAILFGRSPAGAWGGTNLLALSSTLYDVSTLPPAEFSSKEDTVSTRWWFDRTFTKRDTPFGPVISDAPLLAETFPPNTALRWMGHEVSDEISAFLAAGRAKNAAEFRSAFATYAVSGQTFLFASTTGDISGVTAARLDPAAARVAPQFIASPIEPDHQWSEPRTVTDLPSVVNPPEGFLVSANNPLTTQTPPPSFFKNNNERVVRLREILASNSRFSIEDAARAQQDTFDRTSKELSDRLVACLAFAEGAPWQQALRSWNGFYAIDSVGATTFQHLISHLITALYPGEENEWLREFLPSSTVVLAFLAPEIDRCEEDRFQLLLREIVLKHTPPETPWGEVHRISLQHPFARIPLLGRGFTKLDLPAPGSTSTVLKTAHEITDKRHTTRYGQNARFVADLSDPDKTIAILIGGQDGYPGSANEIDQLPLWQRGEFITLPLSPSTAARSAVVTLRLARMLHESAR